MGEFHLTTTCNLAQSHPAGTPAIMLPIVFNATGSPFMPLHVLKHLISVIPEWQCSALNFLGTAKITSSQISFLWLALKFVHIINQTSFLFCWFWLIICTRSVTYSTDLQTNGQLRYAAAILHWLYKTINLMIKLVQRNKTKCQQKH